MKKIIPSLFLFLVITYLVFLIRPAISGDLSGTFRPTSVPQDYSTLEKHIANDDNFYRTMWVPSLSRFGYYSNIHPAISASGFFRLTEASDITNKLAEADSLRLLQEASVKYVIVPYDAHGEIFITDREYDEEKYTDTINSLKDTPYLKEIGGFGKIKVFEVPNPQDHFFSEKEELILSYKFINPTKYIVDLENAKKGDVLVFSENYNLQWYASIEGQDGEVIKSTSYGNNLNSFVLNKSGRYTLEIYYLPQKYVNLGMVISGATLLGVLIVLFYLYRKK